jgi:hypothetical protein
MQQSPYHEAGRVSKKQFLGLKERVSIESLCRILNEVCATRRTTLLCNKKNLEWKKSYFLGEMELDSEEPRDY